MRQMARMIVSRLTITLTIRSTMNTVLIKRLLVGLVAGAILTFLYIKTHTIDIEQHNNFVDLTRQLKQLEAIVNQDILKIRYGQLPYYDPLTDYLNKLPVFFDGLHSILGKHTEKLPNEVHINLNRLSAIFDIKIELLEQFKSQNAILHNSLVYFPKAVMQIEARIPVTQPNGRKLKEGINTLLRRTLAYSLSSNDSLKQKINQTMRRVLDANRKFSPALRLDIQILLAHVNIIIENKAAVDGTVQRLVSMPTAMRIDELFHAHNDSYQLALARSDNYQLALYILSVLLIAYVVTILVQLNRLTFSLRKSVRELQSQKFAMDEHAIVSITDSKGIITYANEKFEETSLWAPADLIGQNHRVVKSDYHSKEFYKEMWETITNGNVWHGQILNLNKNGDPYWVETTIVPFMDEKDKPYQYVAIRTDITEIKQTQAEVQTLNEELEERVASRTAELETAYSELETFSYSVSHDLRAPLNTIDGFSQALISKYEPSLDKTGQSYLQRISTESKRMARLIDDIMKLSRVTSHNIRRSKVELSDIAQEVIDQLRETNPDRNVEFNLEEGLTIHADNVLIGTALDNLLGNAWKYTAKTDNPHISFSSSKENGETIYCVKDNGAGFDMQYANKLFRAFKRLHSAAEFEGTGVGLATVKRIIDRHGGRIWVEAEVNKGAAFYFTVPSDSN